MFDMPMTKEQQRVEALASFLEGLDLSQFNINNTIVTGECGTIACIAGYAALMAIDEGLIERSSVLYPRSSGILRSYGEWARIKATAQDYLDLSTSQADILFYPVNERHRPTPAEAAAALRRTSAGLPIWEGHV